METPDKPERWRGAGDPSLAQAFLEQVAPLLRDQPTITPALESRLAAIAEQVGMSESQRQLAVQLLLQQRALDNPLADDSPPVGDDGPPAVQPAAGDGAQQPPPLPDTASAPPVQTAPAPADAPPRSLDEGRSQAPTERFLESAIELIAAQQGNGAPHKSRLAQLAQESGLSDTATSDLLASLTGVAIESPDQPSPPDPAAPVPVPPPRSDSEKTPDLLFVDYAREVCQRIQSQTLSRGAVRKLARIGRNQYRLSSVYVGQLLQQVADDCGVQMPGQPAPPEPTTRTGVPDDPRLNAFLEAAAPILAEYRGITPQSRLLLSAVAGDHQLSESDLELAIGHLQADPAGVSDTPVSGSQLRERVESFRRHLGEVLLKQPHGIITPRIHRKLREAGVQGEGLPIALAKETIQSVAQEAGVRTITQERAVEFIDRLLDDLLEHRSRINGTMRQQLHQEGRQWGLAADQVNAVISERLAANQVRRMRAARRTTTVFALMFVVLLGICAVLVYQILQYEPPVARPGANPTGADAERDSTSENSGTAPVSSSPPVGNDWWDGALVVAITQARGADAAWREPLEQVRASSETTRSQAYQQLVDLASKDVDNRTKLQLLGNVLAGCYASEPSDVSAGQLRDALLMTLIDPEATLDPKQQAPFELSIWAIETVATALSRQNIPDERSAELAEAAGERVGWLIDASLSSQDLHRQCRAAISRHFFYVLTVAVAFHPVAIHSLHDYVYEDARNWLDGAELDRLDAEFLVEALPRVGDDWDGYRVAVERCVRSPDPAVILNLLDMYQQATNRTLISYLTDLLLARAGKPAGGAKLTPEDVAERVRVSLGTDSATTPEGRWRVLWSAASTAVDRLSEGPGGAEWALLDDVLQLAHLNTMACALDQKDLGVAVFDKLHRQGAPPATRNLDDPGPSSRSPFLGLSGTTRSIIEISRRDREVTRTLNTLSSPRVGLRRSALSRLVELTKDADLTSEQATKFSRYLTAKGRNQTEFEYLLAALPYFRHLPYLKLALADYVGAQQTVAPQLAQVVARLLGHEEPDDGASKVALQQQLLQAALPLGSGDDGRSEAGIHDSAQELLTEAYATQARLRGLPAAQYQGARSPSEVLAALVRHAAGLLEPSVEGPDRRFVIEIDKRIAAAEYLSQNDFALTVRLQRLWLRLLALNVVQRHAKLATQAEAIVRQLHQQDDQSTRLVAQLRSGETALLQTWLLLAEETQ